MNLQNVVLARSFLLYHFCLNKFSVLLFIVVLFASSLKAQLLWQITGNNIPGSTYLFGTHHLIEKEKIVNFDSLLSKIRQVDVVIGEMEMSEMTGLNLKMMQASVMKDTTMRDLLDEEEYQIVDEELKSTVGAGLDRLGKIKPMAIGSLYSVMQYMQHHHLKKQPEAVDLILQKSAKKYKKEIIGFETPEQQINILYNSIPLKRQAEILVDDIKHKEENLKELDLINNAYIAGDLALLETIYLNDDVMSDEEDQLLLEQRNDNWIKQLSKILPHRSCFIAVGCMHLVGASGLIYQLRKAGYTVEPVCY